MSQPQSTVLNGPSGELTMAFKDAHQPPDTNKVPSPGGIDTFSQQGSPLRPQLQRVDSRTGLQQQRPPHPNPQQFRPPLLRPQYQGAPSFRPAAPPQQGQQHWPTPTNQPPSIRPNTSPRPTTPYPRPQQPRPPGQQPQRPLLKNLDSSEETTVPPRSDGNVTVEDRQQGLKSRNMNLGGSPEVAAETRRVSVGSVGNVEDAKNKADEEIPSRPESRASITMHMKKIEENVTVEEKAPPPNSLSLNSTSEKPPTGQNILHPENPESKLKKPEISGKPPKIPEILTARTPSPAKSKTLAKKEGDNDSGVDESTQGNDHSNNGDHSPRKSARNNSRLTTPTKNRSFSRGSRSPNLRSPDSTPSTPSTADKKKVPMNKIQVGSAPSPNLKVVKSKIGSLANATYKPGGGKIKIETKKIDLSHAQSKVGAKNDSYVPSGGDKKIVSQKLQWSAKSKIGSLENTTHKPKGGERKIETVKLDFKEKAKSKVGSKDNIKHQPGGGDIKIETKKLNIKVESKIGSLDNMKHKPGGGDKKIFDDKEYLRQKSGLSNENNSVTGSQNSLPSQTSDAREPVSDENLNREH